VRRRHWISHCQLLWVGGLLLFGAGAGAQEPYSEGTQQPQATSKAVEDAWSSLLQDTIPQAKVDPTLTAPQIVVKEKAAGDFLNHFFFETRTEYWRTQTAFTGLPTVTGVINAVPGTEANPNGIPDPSVFQPSSNQLYSFMDWGTRGWLSDRINTNFSIWYQQDLSHVNEGSPELSIINTFSSNRLLALLSANVEITGRPTDGVWAGTSLRLGRQYVYGAELAALDGASFTLNRPRYSLTLYGGRRFTYFSDPAQRAIGGGNFVLRFGHDSSFEYNGLFYIKGSHVFSYRTRFRRAWLFNSYFKMVGSYPVDVSVNGIWTPSNGKTTVNLSVFQKITNKDYFYDYTDLARYLDPTNAFLSLNLGPFSPFTQFVIDARRTINSRLRLGGSLWVRWLDHSSNQGPFDTSFQDYRVDAQVFPWRKITTFFGYHERDSDRKSPVPSTGFGDISAAGETKIQDFSLEVGRSFGEGRLTLNGGGFYRRLNFQDQFVYIYNAHDKGLLGSAQVKLDQRTRLYADYSLDSDFFVFRPSIQHAQVLRLGIAWKY
jgi:hypothetical protein